MQPLSFLGLHIYFKLKVLFYIFAKTLGQRFDIFSSSWLRFVVSINHCCPSKEFLPQWFASLVAQRLKCLPPTRETQVRSLGWEDPLEKEMAIHSSILAWRIPWTEKPSRLQSTGSQRVGHDWAASPYLLFFSQLFVRPQTTTLPLCTSFSWGWSWSLPPVQCHEPPSVALQALYQI